MLDTVLETRAGSTKLIAAATIALLLTPLITLAQTNGETVAAAPGDQPYRVTYTAQFALDELSFQQIMGYDLVALRDGSFLSPAGRPMLPVKQVGLALPPGMTVTGVSVADVVQRDIDGAYVIFPAQPPRMLSKPVRAADFVQPDATSYGSADAYPSRLAELSHQTDLAGQGIAIVRLSPLQYFPREKRLRLCTALTVIVEGTGGYECGDYLPPSISEAGRAAYERMLTRAVVNPQDVELRTRSDPPPRSVGVGPGDYDYVIITDESWVADFEPLANWKTRKGVPASIVTTDWIYNDGGYTGSDVDKVKAFVVDAHNNWGATYFLLGGDSNLIPYHIRTITIPGYWTDDIPNDTYYADYDEDWTCEVHVSRVGVRSPSGISTFINKVFTYEKNPPLGDYATMTAFFGFDIGDPDDHYGEVAKEYIRSLHLPGSWTLQTEYDSEPGTHKADVLGYLNQGHHLVNHCDHCNTDCMGAGWTCHGDLLYISDINALANGDRQSILFATGCYPANFPAYTCIGEAFVQNRNGGGVAFMGNTRYGWGGTLPDTDHYSMRQDRYFFRALFDQGLYRLGECFSYLKNGAFEGFDPYNLNMYCFTQLTLLGEPELPIWTEDPQSLTVMHDHTLVAGEYTTFPVQVYSGGDPVGQASVCLWKAGDVYEIETTNADGLATFSFTPQTIGTMHVTATCHNYLPYEGQAEVTEAGCVGDLDGDGDTDHGDLGILLADWGCDDPTNGCAGDLTGDDKTDHADLGLLLADWGCGV